jgi:hypothetical protein
MIYRVYDPKDNSITDMRNYKVYEESSYKENRLPQETIGESSSLLSEDSIEHMWSMVSET